MAVGRLDEGHVPVARGPQDRDAGVAQPRTRRVDVVDLVGEVAEEPARGVRLGLVPVVRQLDLRAVAFRAGTEEYEREPPPLVLLTAELAQAKLRDEAWPA